MFESLTVLLKSLFGTAAVDKPSSSEYRDYSEENDHTRVVHTDQRHFSAEPLSAKADDAARQILTEAQEKAIERKYGETVVVRLNDRQQHIDQNELNNSLNSLLVTEFTGLTPKDETSQSDDSYHFVKIFPWKDDQ